MRYLALIALFLSPFSALAITGGSARFDFTQGAPSIVDNQTSLCTGATTVRYYFTSGQPSQVFDSTATCTAVSVTGNPRIIILQGSVVNNQGSIVLP
jgi:hypothetical protein